MQLTELHQQIVSKKPDKFYIFYGEEIGIMDIYLKQIYKLTKADLVRCSTVQEAFSRMTQRRLGGAPRCFVVRDDKDFLKQEKIWDTVFGQAENGQDYLILVYSSMDKRSKLYKQQQDRMTEFAKLLPENLVRYIQKELPGMPVSGCHQLAEVCECDYNRIILECDKIRQYYSQAHSLDYGACFQHLLEQGAIHQPIGDITFKFTDAILTRNVADTAEYLRQARLKGEPEIMVLSILYNGFKQILMVQGLGNDQRDPCKRTGLTPWQVKLAKEKQGHYSISELLKALETVRFVEKGIKTGQIEAEVSLEYLIVNIM